MHFSTQSPLTIPLTLILCFTNLPLPPNLNYFRKGKTTINAAIFIHLFLLNQLNPNNTSKNPTGTTYNCYFSEINTLYPRPILKMFLSIVASHFTYAPLEKQHLSYIQHSGTTKLINTLHFMYCTSNFLSSYYNITFPPPLNKHKTVSSTFSINTFTHTNYIHHTFFLPVPFPTLNLELPDECRRDWNALWLSKNFQL